MGALALGGLRAIAMGLGGLGILDHVKGWFSPGGGLTADPTQPPAASVARGGGVPVAVAVAGCVAVAGAVWYRSRRRGRRGGW